MSDIKEHTLEQLKEEIARRETIKNGDWPKKFNIVVHHDGDEDTDILNFLEDECGFINDSDEFDKAINIAYEVTLNCEVWSDGRAEIIGVEDRILAPTKTGADLVREILDKSPDKTEAIITALCGKSRSKSHVYKIKSVAKHNENFEVTVSIHHFMIKDAPPVIKTGNIDKNGNLLNKTLPPIQL